MKKAVTASVSHTEETIKELRADRQFAVAYLKAALEELDDPNNRAAGLLALRDVAEAYGGLGMVAGQAGISREALYRSLSPKGNPTLKTLLAVLKSVGMRLSVEPENKVHALCGVGNGLEPIGDGRLLSVEGRLRPNEEIHEFQFIIRKSTFASVIVSHLKIPKCSAGNRPLKPASKVHRGLYPPSHQTWIRAVEHVEHSGTHLNSYVLWSVSQASLNLVRE